MQSATSITTLSLFIAMLLGGCSDGATEVLVVTDSDLAVPGEIDSLETVVRSPSGDMQRSMADLTAQGFPRSLSLVHETGELGPFTVSVGGRLGGSVVVQREASFSFVEGETRVLTMHLVAACVTTSCPGDQSCTETGCQPVDVPESGLSPWTGSPPTLGAVPDAGMPPTDACAPSDEICNDEDDDCDGMVDEGFDLMSDPDNCGVCGMGCRGRDDMCCDGSCERRCG